MTSPPPLMVEARRVLLDALEALSAHRRSLVLVGAQAVYLRTSEIDLSFSASFTTDADLVVDPSTLGSTPLLGDAMTAARFVRTQPDRPGIWGKVVTVDGLEETVPVDLIVPEALAGAGRRGARLGPHGKQAAGRAIGLEAAVVDRGPLTIPSLDRTDNRSILVDVAGPTALVIAKLHKLGERVAAADVRPDRVLDKDAADAYRLMLHLEPRLARTRFRELAAHPAAGETTRAALVYLQTLFASPASPGVVMARRGLATDVPRERVEVVCTDFARRVPIDAPDPRDDAPGDLDR